MNYQKDKVNKDVINMIANGIEEHWKAEEKQQEDKIYDKYERK